MVTEEKQTEETKTVTPEKSVEELKAELQKAQEEMKKFQLATEEKDKGFKTLQRQLAEEQARVKRVSDIDAKLNAIDEKMKITIAAVATGAEEDTERGKQIKKEFLSRYDEADAKAKQDLAMKQAEETANSFKSRVEALGLTQEDEDYWEIHDLVVEGKYPRAELKIKKLEASKNKPATDTNKESEEVRINRLAEEKARKLMEEKGLLDVDAASPSAAATDFNSAAKLFAEGKITRKEYETKRR
jgi:penicillin-binding protein 1A